MVNFHLNRSSTVRALGPVDSFAERTVFSILCYSHLGFISWVISFYIHCISKKNYFGIMFFKFNKNTVCDLKHIRRGHFRVKGTHRLYFFFLHILVALSNMNMPLFCEYYIHQVLQQCFPSMVKWLRNGMGLSWEKVSWKINFRITNEFWISMARKSREVLAASQPFHSGLIIWNNKTERR